MFNQKPRTIFDIFNQQPHQMSNQRPLMIWDLFRKEPVEEEYKIIFGDFEIRRKVKRR